MHVPARDRARVVALALALVALALAVALAACGPSSSSGANDAGIADSSVVRLDAPTTCSDAATSCDPFLSCGCAPAEKCVPAGNGLACQPAGTGAADTPCSADPDCARGTVCIAYAGQTSCHAFCDDVHACSAGACYIRAADQSGHPVGTVCGPTCSLLARDCPGGLACYPASEAPDGDHGICLTAGTGTEGSPCSAMTDCESGLACIDPSGPPLPICAKICNRSGGEPSCDESDAGTCRALLSSSEPSQTGVCLP